MPVTIPNLDFLRTLDPQNLKDFGPKLAEALQALGGAVDVMEQQTNSNVSGTPEPPPAPNKMMVSGQNGHFQIAIEDQNEVYRGVSYFVEHADNPQFTNPHTVELGAGRNFDLPLGNVKRYFRSYSSYPGSPPSQPVYYGDAGNPYAVVGGGTDGGPAFLKGQSSGTGNPGEGLTGNGIVPFRSPNGAPPKR